MPVYEIGETAIPESLKRHDHWVLWGLDGHGRKRPLAPWVRGDLYPVKWGADAPERPETDWETAYHHYRHREQYATPDGIDAADVLPAPLLLHDPLDPPLMQVDFDDVRDPETGVVTDEVAAIVDRLGAFCEVSQSGEGLHSFVRAELPGGLGKFIASLADTGDIELYDHGRAVGATWDHVADTPTQVPHVQAEIEAIIQEYESSTQRQRRLNKRPQRAADGGAAVSLDGATTSDSGDSEYSPYFDVDVRTVADTGYFSSHRRSAPGDDWEGPHPEHGPIHSAPDECTNFGAVPLDNVWYCFAHDSGGRGIELASVLCPATDIECADVPDSDVGGWLRDKPLALLQTCLWLREQGAVSQDAKPPYDALLAVADVADLHVRDRTAGILGEANAEISRAVYDELTLDELSE